MKTSKGYWLGDQQQKERRCSASAVGTVAAAWNKCRTHKQCSSKNDVNKFGKFDTFRVTLRDCTRIGSWCVYTSESGSELEG